ncbi:MAG: DUF6519 domain-containing protein [Planctomycetota bacterium]
MTADRARISFDPSRKYREVVAQQGRVTLEADGNEAERISTEEVRHHALDFVGPCGTPDDGYKVEIINPGGTNLKIGKGTMYVGGLRLYLAEDESINFDDQRDWLDKTVDPLWLKRPLPTQSFPAHVVLLAREQEITAVEDPALREVALGGPDTAARTRILQRIVLAKTTGTRCADAAKDIGDFWSGYGLVLNPLTAELKSRSRLKVTLVTTNAPSSVCDPPAQSGYLGADNQMIRVQITEYKADGTGKLIWGYNNASTLYQAKVTSNKTLELSSTPISPEHTPRVGQTVQVLLGAAFLGDGAYAAALNGHVTTLSANFDAETKQVTLVNALPAEYPTNAIVFLRLWEKLLDFTLGTPVNLTKRTDTDPQNTSGSGLQVTITGDGSGSLHVGDYWCIAARPTTPNAVYPERFLVAAQPPDGPRQWTCSLAVVGGTVAGKWQHHADCRLPFDNLPELTKRPQGDDCCCVTLKPSQARELQGILDNLLQAEGRLIKVVVKLEPGEYVLPRPLRIDRRHVGLVIESCTGHGTILSAGRNGTASTEFGSGMIWLLGATNVTLRGLTFMIPQSPVQQDDEFIRSVSAHSIGLHLVNVSNVMIEDCEFLFQAPGIDDSGGKVTFGAAVLGRDTVQSLRISGCRFASALGVNLLLSGLQIVPRQVSEENSTAIPVVDDLIIESCRFDFVTFGAMIVADAKGIAARHNRARGCYGSVLLLSVPTGFDISQIVKTEAGSQNDPGFNQTRRFLDEVQSDQVLLRTLAIGTAIRVPKDELGPARPIPIGTIEDVMTIREAANVSRPLATGAIALPSSAFISQAVSVTVFAAAKPPQPSLALDLSGNEFDCRALLNKRQESGPAVFVWDLNEQPSSRANVHGNTVWSRSSRFPTLMMLMVESFNITGNVLINDLPEPGNDETPGNSRFALLVVPGGRSSRSRVPIKLFTVTGNTMTGSSNLRHWVREEWMDRVPQEWQERLKGELNRFLTWEFFNTET